MWPFKPAKRVTPRPAPEPDTLPPSQVERLEALESRMAALTQEWGDTLDRISRHFSRVAARERQRLHRDLQTLENAEDAPGPTNAGQPEGNSLADRKAALRAAVNASKLRRA